MSRGRSLRSTRTPLGLLTIVALFVSGIAFGHAELVGSEPAANSTVTSALGSVAISFTEPVETRFSIFKVYRLEAEVDMTEGNAWQRLNGLAGALVSDALTLRDDDKAEARVDEGLIDPEARSTEVTIGLEENLTPGVYVVMWRVLSIDTHTTQGFAVFDYAPTTE